MSGSTTITRATPADAPEILALIKRAFAPAAILYDAPDLPPLAESLDEHRARYDTHVVLKACGPDGTILGSVQGQAQPDGTVYVARLVVDPERQGRGIARALMAALEDEFPDAEGFALFTGNLNDASLRLYASLGYREVRRDVVDERLTLVWMEKRR